MSGAADNQTLSYLMRRLAEAGIHPKGKHGQNFLIDLNLLRLLVDAAALSPEPPGDGGSGDDPAHLLFTSGSTGAPKGVVVAQRNVIAFVTWANAYFGLDESDRISCHSPLVFDLSTWDLFGGFAAMMRSPSETR